MTARFRSIRNRLAKIERQLDEKQHRIDLASCNCESMFVVKRESDLPAAKETLRSRPCPAHGLNHQTIILIVRYVTSPAKAWNYD